VIATKESPAGKGERILLFVLFVSYLVLLAWIVLWKLEVPYVGGGALREIKLIPFLPSGGFGTVKPFELIANLVLFVPFGMCLTMLAPSWAWWKVAAVIAGSSLVLEAAQYVLAVGSSDITDVIVNTAGGVVGIGLVAVAARWLRERTAKVMTRVCSIVLALALVLSAVFIASPLRYASPRDGVTSTHGHR
jgi:glycopeptide antibiotics resistance protein